VSPWGELVPWGLKVGESSLVAPAKLSPGRSGFLGRDPTMVVTQVRDLHRPGDLARCARGGRDLLDVLGVGRLLVVGHELKRHTIAGREPGLGEALEAPLGVLNQIVEDRHPPGLGRHGERHTHHMEDVRLALFVDLAGVGAGRDLERLFEGHNI